MINLRERRLGAKLGQRDAAQAAGISRQAYASIEARRAVPSVAIALRLAELFGTTVEDLFAQREATIAAEGEGRVAIARIGDRWIARALLGREHELAADGIASHGTVDLLRPPSVVRENVLVLGCAPVLGTIAERLNGESGRGRFVWLPVSSTEALDALATGAAHIGGVHFGDADANAVAIRKRLGKRAAQIALADWEVGLVVARGNPRGIRGITGVLDRRTRVVLREVGSGARRAFDRHLRKAGGSIADLGSPIVVHDHRAVGSLIAMGAADVGFSVRDVAIAYGLDFIALGSERFDLVLERGALGDPRIARWLDSLTAIPTRRELESLGYDVTHTGAAA